MGKWDKQFSGVIASTYEAAMDADAWPELLRQIAAFTNSDTAIFRVPDISSDAIHISKTYNLDDSYLRLYRKHYITNDPFRAALKQAKSGEFHFGEAAISYQNLVRHDVYNDLLRPNGLLYNMGGVIMRDNTLSYQMVVQRQKYHGDYRVDDLNNFNRLIFPLQQAFKITRHMAEAVHHREVSELLLDKLSTGIILCDAEGDALYLNRMAEKLLSDQTGLGFASGRLVTSFSQASSKLQQLISNALGKNGMPAAGGMSMVSSLPGHPLLSIMVAPVQSGNQERLAFLHKHACAVVFIGLPMQTDAVDTEVVRMLYGLTEAEARLTAALAQGKSLEEICSFFQISYHTGRSQLKSIFSKTGVNRQNELVNLILSSPAAL
jgi:DNA-binding CsgD family transcriptional regulator/PAS domain-containing protein